ncbi:MAG TPA: TonB-dependent receptor [Novosphingobium sp.]|nr:TonB-dependent receptor [Novosphingobium sp.]
MAAPSLRAQEDPNAIVVTGERVSRKAAEADSSLSVATAETIEALSGADRLEQLLALTPNLQLGSGGEGPTIRGQDTNGALRDMPAFLGGTRPRVTLQVDGRPVSYNELAFGVTGLWDVARIEVYRSPQTTTQGRNSIAGAIFVETAAPAFDWGARARLIEGDYGTHQASGVVTGPIVADQLAFRLSGDRRRSRTSSVMTSTTVGTNYNRDAYDVLRLKLLATPTTLPGASLTAIVSHNRSKAPQVEGIRAPYRDRRDPLATYGVFGVRVDALTLRGEYRPPGPWSAAASVSLGEAAIRRFAPAGFGEARIAAHDRTAELVATWARNPSLRVLAGVNAVHVALDQRIDLTAALLGRGAFRDRQDSLGLFGQAEWQVDDRLKLTAGARYQRDHQLRTGALGVGSLSPLPLAFDQRFAALLPKLSLSYQPATWARVGVLVQRAANPGGVTLDTRRRIADTFDPESLWAYEVFARVALPGGKADLSANLFRYALRDAQRTITAEFVAPGGIVTTAEVGNAPRARSRGAELELSWRPTPRLQVRASTGLLRTRITRTLSSADPLLDKEFQRSPHLTAAIAADWRPSDALRLSAQARHNSGYFSEDTNDPLRRVPRATVVDLRGSWRRGPVELSGYVRNVFDRFYLTYLFSPAGRLATAGDPREVGAALELRF